MKLFILSVLLCLYPVYAQALEVTLAWDANTEPDLQFYNVYQAENFGDHTGPWVAIAQIAKPITIKTVLVDATKNFSWYVTAVDQSGNESLASNTVTLYDKIPPDFPKNLIKTLGGNTQ